MSILFYRFIKGQHHCFNLNVKIHLVSFIIYYFIYYIFIYLYLINFISYFMPLYIIYILFYSFTWFIYRTVAPSSNLTWHLTRYIRTCDTSFPRPTTVIAYSSFPHLAGDHLHLPPTSPQSFLLAPFGSVRGAPPSRQVSREKTRPLVSRSFKSRVMRAL